MNRVGAAVCLLLLASCGRLHFDDLSLTGDGGNGDAADARSDGGDTALPRVLYVKASNSDAGDIFGHAAALSADGLTLAVGAPLESSAATTINGNQTDNSATEAGAVYVFRRTGDTWTQEAYLKASNAQLGDQFGWSVALAGDGNTLVVGARREDSASIGPSSNQADNNAQSAGAAYVFTRAGSTWTQQVYLKASNTEGFDAFGERVAISEDGNTVAVGSAQEDSAAITINGDGANNAAIGAGAVYVFTRAGTIWTQQAYVKPSNAGAGDEFGYKLALNGDGNTLVVGAYREDSPDRGIGGTGADGLDNSGAAYVFTRAGTVWTQSAYIKSSNSDLGDNFGYSIGISGDGTVVAIGSESEASAATGIGGNEADNSATASGAIYVFTGGGATWSQTAYIKAQNSAAFDGFGFCNALSSAGTTLLGGALYEDSAATGLEGDDTNNAAPGSGAGYVFTNAGTGWSPRWYVKGASSDANDELGWSCTISATGKTFALGAAYEDGSADGINGTIDDLAMDAGAVYLFF